MKCSVEGFTLIEIMIVTAILGIVASLAWPAYQVYVARSRITEGLFLPAGLQAEVATEVDDANSLMNLADSWNGDDGTGSAASKYVESVTINELTGEITVLFNENNIGAIPEGSTIVLTPYRMTSGEFKQLQEAIDENNAPNRNMTTWGCASSSNEVAKSKGYEAVNLGTLAPEFVPPECR